MIEVMQSFFHKTNIDFGNTFPDMFKFDNIKYIWQRYTATFLENQERQNHEQIVQLMHINDSVVVVQFSNLFRLRRIWQSTTSSSQFTIRKLYDRIGMIHTH